MLMLCFAATGFIILPISHKIERERKTNLMELHLNSLKTVPAQSLLACVICLVRTRKHKGVEVSFPFLPHHNLIAITVQLSNLQKANRVWLHSHRVC